ncbi:MAG: putative bifunctional diguanylate cyclase/phosphodiesterase [Ilumatobacteraceae bacterium]
MRQRLGGLPLAAYVVALLLMPLAAMTILSIDEVQRNNRTADAADRVAATIDIELATIGVLLPLEVERMSLVGMARLAELGIDPAAVVPELDAGLDGSQDADRAALDSAFDELEAALVARRGATVGGFVAAIRASRLSLEDLRRGVDDGTTRPLLVDAGFDRITALLDAVLADAAEDLSSTRAGTADTADVVGDVRLAVDVALTATNEAGALSDVIVSGSDVDATSMMEPAFRHRDALAAAADGGLDVGELRSGYNELTALPTGLADGTLATGADLLADLATSQRLVTLLLERLDHLDAVTEFAMVDGKALSEEASALAEAANRRNQLTVFGLLAVGLGSVIFGIVVIRSFARPLTQLRAEAERISDGDLDAHSLALEGPSDIRKVTAAMNEMAGTLRSVDVHMKALAAGDPDERALLELPGEVGASMRHSVERVTVLTSELQISQQLLERQARHDPLTGLPNRLAMLEHLDEVISERGDHPDVGVMFVDVDGFKSVNDTHGHAIGDVVLTEIARRLSESVREVDMVARLGGDEFLVVVEHCSNPLSLESFGQRVIREIEQPHAVGDQWFAVSASVGITIVEPADDAMAAIARADAAVYHAKRRGRRRVEMFDADLQSSIEHTAALELALRQAIEGEQLRVFLQPMGDLTTGEVTAVEALVRWDRPGVGVVAPGEFIPIAERSGLIFDLERWVTSEVCRLIARWKQIDPDCGVRLSVNISGRHLIEADLVADLDAAIAASGADPTMLEVELTESQLLDDVDRAGEVLDELRRRGIRIAIDDFGTGYSSMTYLQRLPIDVVKIDQSFITSAPSNGFDSTIVEAVVTIGRTLALDVVAEGVETPEQLAYAREKGVTRAQGYLLAPPMPADEAELVIFGGPIIDVDAVLVPSAQLVS